MHNIMEIREWAKPYGNLPLAGPPPSPLFNAFMTRANKDAINKLCSCLDIIKKT